MQIDLPAAAGMVTRAVRSGEREGRPTRLVVARRNYTTDQPDLWDALTNVERIPRWFMPVSGDLEVGGRYQLEGNAGGTIEACAEPHSFAVTWEFGGSTSWLAVHLAPADDGTALELVHEAPVDRRFWDQYGPGATGLGWDLALVALGHHLDTGEGFEPGDEEALSGSPEGAEFLRLAAAGWAEAAIADGDDVSSARAAAERSAAFFTPEPADDSADADSTT